MNGAPHHSLRMAHVLTQRGAAKPKMQSTCAHTDFPNIIVPRLLGAIRLQLRNICIYQKSACVLCSQAWLSLPII